MNHNKKVFKHKMFVHYVQKEKATFTFAMGHKSFVQFFKQGCPKNAKMLYNYCKLTL